MLGTGIDGNGNDAGSLKYALFVIDICCFLGEGTFGANDRTTAVKSKRHRDPNIRRCVGE
jgi:hypothetical protein